MTTGFGCKDPSHSGRSARLCICVSLSSSCISRADICNTALHLFGQKVILPLEKELTQATCHLVYLEQHSSHLHQSTSWQDFVLMSESAFLGARQLKKDARLWLDGPAASVKRWTAAQSVIRGRQQRMHLTRDNRCMSYRFWKAFIVRSAVFF